MMYLQLLGFSIFISLQSLLILDFKVWAAAFLKTAKLLLLKTT